MNLYDITVKDAELNNVGLETYKGKVLLIVNTATKCGFTPQYTALEALYEHYGPQGFEVLDFPCNQFGAQAPGSNEEIANFCQGKFGVTFKAFDKIDVNGKNEEPLYAYLKKQSTDDLEDANESSIKKAIKSIGKSVLGTDIKWNFTKFLVDKNGNVVGRFAPTVKPESLNDQIEKLLAE